MPCGYNALLYLNQARMGPISGANITLYKATEEGDPDREILYSGKTSISSDIDKAGIISLPVPNPQATSYTEAEANLMNAIEGYEGDFILEMSGGLDIDKEDDFVVDSSFTQVNGKLRLILSKEKLLQNDYKINILTEIGYQLSKDLLGEHYDKVRLQARLDDIAKRVLIEKIYPNAEQPLGRDDLFYWVPMAFKNWLVKPYDTTLAPIVEKVYAGENIYEEAYNYVYNPLPETLITVPVVKSHWFKVDENSEGGIFVGEIKPVSEGNSSITGYTLSGSGSELFNIDIDGKVYLEENATLDYETVQMYQMQLHALNDAGESKPVTLYITINNLLDVPEDRSFSGGIIPEDAVEGDVVGTLTFASGASPIERIEIGGVNASDFTVDLNGTIRVSGTASFDYESANSAKITLQAFNALGGSRVVPISMAITDVVDVPIVKMLDVHLEENATIGQEVGTVSILTNDPLTNVVLLGDGSASFSIDLNGTVRVVKALDYESRANYVLQVKATNIQGVGRLGTLVIRIDNVPDVPQLGHTTLHVLEQSVVGTLVGQVQVDNSGNSPILAFELTGAGSEHFSIDTDGKITLLTDTLTHTTQEFYNLFVTASNSAGDSLQARVVIYVDTHKPILGILDSWVYEDASAGTLIGKVPVARTASNITSMRMEGAGSQNFTIDEQGDVKVANGATLDYESTTRYNLRVFASNSAGESEGTPLYIRVINKADTLNIQGFSTTIYEDTSVGETIGFVSVLEYGGKTIDHYEVTGTGSENFEIGNTGIVTLKSGAVLDSVQTPKYQLFVSAVDSDGVKSNQVILDISVAKSINTVPQISELTINVSENTEIGSVIGQASIVSKTELVEQTWIIGVGSDTFELKTDGRIVLKQEVDYELKNHYPLGMHARNALGESQAVSLNIYVTNIIDDEPVLGDSAFNIVENSEYGTEVGKIEILSIGSSPLTQIELSGTGADQFSVDANGTVRVAGNLDYESVKTYQLKAVATNSKADSAEADVTITILNIPEHIPTLNAFTGSVLESADIGTVIGAVEASSSGDSFITTYQLNDKAYLT